MTELARQEWAVAAEGALSKMRAALETLNRTAARNTDERRALDTIAGEVNGLSRLLDDLGDAKGEA